jgi:heat shock protein HslJ
MKKNKQLSILGIFFLATLLLNACSSRSKGLDATSWKLDSYQNQQEQQANVLPDSVITIDFQTENYSGLGGCNSYSGTYKTDGDNLTFGTAAPTRKVCTDPPGIMDQEKTYLDALGKVTNYKVSGDTLEMFDNRRNSLLKYTRAGQ